jgi:acyl dehydratase
VTRLVLATGELGALVRFHVRPQSGSRQRGCHFTDVVLESGPIHHESGRLELAEAHSANGSGTSVAAVAVDRSAVGRSTGSRRVVIERGPVAVFADAVKDTDPVYRDAEAAVEAGHPSIPVPPTFPFVMAHWGAFPDIQPPESEGSAGMSAVGQVLGPLLAKGGLLLHGEQEFEYSSPVHVGDVLFGEGVISDVYEKVSGSATMTFVVTETTWRHDSTGEVAVVARSNTLVRTANQAG